MQLAPHRHQVGDEPAFLAGRRRLRSPSVPRARSGTGRRCRHYSRHAGDFAADHHASLMQANARPRALGAPLVIGLSSRHGKKARAKALRRHRRYRHEQPIRLATARRQIDDDARGFGSARRAQASRHFSTSQVHATPLPESEPPRPHRLT